ncbi:MAG: hypothetical protein ACI915_000014 [Gammaproteobacteria bacterium]|jgi:hypothetical protein
MIDQADDVAAVFLGWQCRLRQHVVRRSDGRPSAGMCPEAVVENRSRLGPIVTLIVKDSPEHAIALFQHIVRTTHDPLERYEAAVRILQNVYYQYPREFSDSPTALFNLESKTAETLLAAATCTLEYMQGNQSFHIPCTVHKLPDSDPHYRATYWHNAMFNPRLRGPAQILKFEPHWSQAVAEGN